MKQKLFILALFAGIHYAAFSVNKKEIEKKQPKKEWVWLFNGKSTDSWRTTTSDLFPAQGWKISDGVLTVLAKTNNSPGGQDIITKEQYSNFELQLECKLTEGANSGIKYFVVNTIPGQKGNYLGLEYQLIDNDRHPDARLGINGNRTMSSLYDLITAKVKKKILLPGKWNKVRLVVDGSHVEHWLNGEKVLEFDRKSDAFRELVKISKYKDFKDFGEYEKGHILLQGHSDEVSFRSIRIKSW